MCAPHSSRRFENRQPELESSDTRDMLHAPKMMLHQLSLFARPCQYRCEDYYVLAELLLIGS